MASSLIASIITYNPDNSLESNIDTYYDHVDKIIIVDNSEKDMGLIFNRLSERGKISIIRNNQNLGIATALNIAANFAIENNFEWLLTMDQDSCFDTLSITAYKKCFEDVKAPAIGMIGINYSAATIASVMNECSFEKQDTLITSGSMLNLSAFKEINGFNESLFIDGVDDEFCFRLFLNNFQVIRLHSIYLKHSLGKNVVVKNWLIGPLVERNIHPPIRIYYMTRNYLYLIKKYKRKFPEKTNEYKRVLVNKLKNNILYSQNRFDVITYFIKGVWHFYSKQMGKFK